MKSKIFFRILYFFFVQLIAGEITAQTAGSGEQELYRPQIHFTPKANWINDPNGMVYSNGIYNLYFQYHPYSSIWGPMHWGHATSTDMIHWKREAIAIYPDSLGTIFSGSAVVDVNNTSGFGKNGRAPLVAIFTQHDTVGEQSGKNNFQNQSIAYSLDNGMSWIKYSGNPVLKNPGLRDFRDPKVMWYSPQKKWVMSVATKNNVAFYSSPDLKNWKKESDFGDGRGAHGGGWECPDLVSINDNGKQQWVLIVNLNPGGPNAGSGTQYFIGDFNGKTFTSEQAQTRWLDYGPDNYAGVTWSNTGKRNILIGWMSNWLYANQVPTEIFRNAMTLPRDLKIAHVGKEIFITSQPVKELSKIYSKSLIDVNHFVVNDKEIAQKVNEDKFPCRINLSIEKIKDFSLILTNKIGDTLIIGYDMKLRQYFIDRTKSGKIDFQKDFGARHVAPRLSNSSKINISLIIDKSSVELFADNGLTVMTEIFFPNKPYCQIKLQSHNLLIKKLEYIKLNGIWN